MLRIISLNVNGIRSASKKGLFTWLLTQQADCICLQELKAQEADLQHALFQQSGYQFYAHYAEKKGYSGVGIYTKHQPLHVKIGLGWPTADQEGRYVEIDFGKLKIISLYLPSGTSGDERQLVKFDFLKKFEKHLLNLKNQSAEVILCGDWNIAHRPIDLKNWRANQKHSGFLPAERAWMDQLFDQFGFVDAFRVMNNEADQYTWWSNRGQAWLKNVGWRIDYQITSPALKDKIKAVSIYKAERFSDHAPLIIDYNIDF